MNLVGYLQKATTYLERHGVASPRLDAELLLASLLGISRLDIYTGFERMLSESEAADYRELLVRRAQGWPLQYLTGETGFRGVRLEVRPGVFIPRPETEVLVESALEVLPEGEIDVIDLCCGCGNVAVSMAAERVGARVLAVDSEPIAVELTARNAEANGVGGRVRAVKGDLFGPLLTPGEDEARFHAVISNPPYVPSGCLESLPVEVRDHEPPTALFAGEDGLDVIRRIVDEAPRFLLPAGWLVLELDESHAEAVIELLRAGMSSGRAEWTESSVELIEDLTGRPRVARACLAR